MLVVGEALVDLVVDDDGAIEAALGGGPFNAARAAARLGAEVDFAGSLSTDRFGREHRVALEADGVGCGLVSAVDLPSTLAMANVGRSGAAEYSFYLDGTAAPSFDPAAIDGAAYSSVLTGGLALAVDPLADRVVGYLERVHPSSVVMVDLNCRPTAVTDRPVYAARLERAATTASIVKASEEDLAFLTPDAPVEEAARSVLRGGASAVLVTRGAEPTIIVTSSAADRLAVCPPPGPIVDTIGAGDTFGGAVLAHLETAGIGTDELRSRRGHDHLVAAATAGHRAAAIVVTRRGADPPRAGELDPG